MDPLVRLERVSYRYPQSRQTVLRDLNLEIAAGSFVGVVGANGAGKSTLCAVLAGFIPHHLHGELEGRAIVDGLDTQTTPLAELVTHVGLVFQNPFNQLSGARLTVEEEVAFGLENLGVPRSEMLARVRETLELVDLAERAGRSPYELSGGEMQRLALASILVMRPRLLVLDEPTAQLDPVGTRQVFSALRSIAAAGQTTIVMVEQKVDWIALFADRILALEEGRLALDGPPGQVLTSPRLPELGVAMPYYARAAEQARALGFWPTSIPLPVSFEQALSGFRELGTQG